MGRKTRIKPLNLEKTLEEVVLLNRIRRALTAEGSVFSRREEPYVERLCDFLEACESYSTILSTGSELTASLHAEEVHEMPTAEEAISWFRKKYPDEAKPLVRKLRRPAKKEKQVLSYGIVENNDLPRESYIGAISEYLHVPKERAVAIYDNLIQLYWKRRKEEGNLAKKTI